MTKRVDGDGTHFAGRCARDCTIDHGVRTADRPALSEIPSAEATATKTAASAVAIESIVPHLQIAESMLEMERLHDDAPGLKLFMVRVAADGSAKSACDFDAREFLRDLETLMTARAAEVAAAEARGREAGMRECERIANAHIANQRDLPESARVETRLAEVVRNRIVDAIRAAIGVKAGQP